MNEKECVGGRNSVFLNFSGTVDELLEYYPNLIHLNTFNEITNVTSAGVYVLKEKDYLQVRIFGGCPNFLQGKCSLGEKCISNLSV